MTRHIVIEVLAGASHGEPYQCPLLRCAEIRLERAVRPATVHLPKAIQLLYVQDQRLKIVPILLEVFLVSHHLKAWIVHYKAECKHNQPGYNCNTPDDLTQMRTDACGFDSCIVACKC